MTTAMELTMIHVDKDLGSDIGGPTDIEGVTCQDASGVSLLHARFCNGKQVFRDESFRTSSNSICDLFPYSIRTSEADYRSEICVGLSGVSKLVSLMSYLSMDLVEGGHTQPSRCPHTCEQRCHRLIRERKFATDIISVVSL